MPGEWFASGSLRLPPAHSLRGFGGGAVFSEGLSPWEETLRWQESRIRAFPDSRSGRSKRGVGKREVSNLAGRGLTNREIAGELHLSEHTVIAHARGIREKLGVHSRARISAWVAEHKHE